MLRSILLLAAIIAGPGTLGWMTISTVAAQRAAVIYDQDASCSLGAKTPPAGSCVEEQLSVLSRSGSATLDLADAQGRTFSGVHLVGARSAQVWTGSMLPYGVDAILFQGRPVTVGAGGEQTETQRNPDWTRHRAFLWAMLAGALTFFEAGIAALAYLLKQAPRALHSGGADDAVRRWRGGKRCRAGGMNHAASERPMFSTRQHWAVFVFQKTFLILIAIAITAAVLNVRGVTHHYLSDLHGLGRFVVERLPLLALAAAAFVLFLNYGLWQITSIRVADGYLTWSFAWNKNLMPAKNMQDISITKSVLGAMLGYSTLVVQSGLTMEILTYVPRAKFIVQQLRSFQEHP